MKDSSVKRLGMILAVQAEVEGMKALNKTREMCGDALAYDDAAFVQASKDITKIVNYPEFHFKEKKQEKPKQTEFVLPDSVSSKIIEFYNTLGVIKSPVKDSVIESVEASYRNLIKKGYTKESIVQSMRNYAEAYNSDWFFNTPWNVATFLKQKNACVDFMLDGDKYIQYKKWKESQKPNKEKEEVKIETFIQ